VVPDTIEREVLIAAPVERVWELLTQAEHLGTWFGDAGAEIDLRPGGAMQFHWREHGTSQARVEAVEPPHRFAYRWVSSREFRGAEPAEGNSTLVEFTLAADGDGTLLKVLESGFASLAADEAERTRHHAGNTEGWKAELGDLVAYAERQAAVR